MKRLEQLVSALTPKRWPVRWRLAAVSAVLTFLILVIFALVVGRLTSNRLQTDFNDELRDASTQLATQLHVQSMDSSQLRQTLADAAGIRVIRVNGDTLGAGQSNLGPPPSTIPGFTNVGSLRVYTERTQDQFGFPEILQYARSTDNVSATIGRLWPFLGLGVLGGTALAALVGIAIAGRAMRPIKTLTSTARSIATTRDPSERIPAP